MKNKEGVGGYENEDGRINGSEYTKKAKGVTKPAANYVETVAPNDHLKKLDGNREGAE